ncbi:hypothetical protein WMY93_011164 [Mugilogobius chulae]|uniref:Uncharacterized protein n=1 Tax=Mugilogobius chulae TaxID=88201 RepID=A0AAW0P1N3_9GOBI
MANIDLAAIGNNTLKSETGETVELKSLWKDQPVVLFFLRRFGCQICRWMASESANAAGIQGNFSGDLLQSGGMLIVDKGGEKVLLHFVQDSPGDLVPLEDISKAVGVSAKVQAGQRPVCNDDVCTR